jgi:hypothetical protein
MLLIVRMIHRVMENYPERPRQPRPPLDYLA